VQCENGRKEKRGKKRGKKSVKEKKCGGWKEKENMGPKLPTQNYGPPLGLLRTGIKTNMLTPAQANPNPVRSTAIFHQNHPSEPHCSRNTEKRKRMRNEKRNREEKQ